MSLFDRVVLLATGLTAIYLLWRLYGRYRKTGAQHDIFYMLGFGVLLIAGLLLIAFTYAALSSPLVVIVAVLIPSGIALGLVSQFLSKYEKAYQIFAAIGFLAVAVTRLANMGGLATVVLIVVHGVAGLLIVAAPIYAIQRGLTRGAFVSVSVGGALIGLGGVALAFLKTGRQLLFFSADFVFAILAPLLLLMTLAFTYGFVRDIMRTR
jgi:hypothetical protein